jgi:hypothetical protein
MSETEKMDEFELALTKALRRVDAPEGFAEKVMGRAVGSGVAASAQVRRSGPGAPDSGLSGVVVMPKRHGSMRMRAWVGGAIAAVLALGMFGAEQLHQRRERAAAANEEFEAAVRVTDHALAQTREQLHRAGLNFGE